MSKKRKVSTAYTSQDKVALCYLFTLSMYQLESYCTGLAEAFNFSSRAYFKRKAQNARAEIAKFAGWAKNKGELNIWSEGEEVVLMRQETILQATNIVISLPPTDEATEWIVDELEKLKFRAGNKFPKQDKSPVNA